MLGSRPRKVLPAQLARLKDHGDASKTSGHHHFFNMFPNLPRDIGRTIFELAAEAGDGLACALVSKQVKPWCVILRSRRRLSLTVDFKG
jgi:hypothetical protein